MRIYKIKNILRSLGRTKVEDKNWLPQSKAALLEFVQRYPVREAVRVRQPIIGKPFLKLTLKPMTILAGIIIAALLAGGGTALASQGSLPGDALYPVKLITEDVETTLSFNPEKKVELEAKFANRRLEEVQKLQDRIKKKKGEMRSEVIEKAMERAAKRLEKAEEYVDEMEEGKLKDRALEAVSGLEEALETHQQILSDLAEEVPASAEQALLRAQEVAAGHSEKALARILKLEKVKEADEKIKKGISGEEEEKGERGMRKIMGAEERAEGKLKALENRLEALENYMENLEEKGVEVNEEAQEKLSEAESRIDEAKDLLEQEKYLEAFEVIHQAMRLLMEVKLLVRPIIMPRPLPAEGPVPMPLPTEPTSLPAEPTILPVSETGEGGESSGGVAPAPVEMMPVPESTVNVMPY